MKTSEFNAKHAWPKAKYRRAAQYYLGHLLVYLGLLIVALVLAWLVISGIRAYTSYQATTAHLLALEESLALDGRSGLNLLELAQTEAHLRGAAQGFDTLNEAASPFLALTPYLGWLPTYGGDLQAWPYLLAAGRDVSRAAMILFDSLTPALKPQLAASDIVVALTQADEDMEQAEDLLHQAQVNLNRIEVKRLSPGTAEQVGQLKAYASQALAGIQFARGLPGLLGAKAPRTYLVLTQNADELRPSGGYINMAGHIVVDRGQIVEFSMQDSYAIDRLSAAYPYPPAPIQDYMAADYWVLRDAGWSPDFPTAAHTALALYELGQGVAADGVIALDQQALARLLPALEPIQVEGERVTGANVIDLMHKYWTPEQGQAQDRQWFLQRKSFMIGLAETVRDKLEQHLDTVNLSLLGNAMRQSLREKHVLIYLADPAQADYLAKRNWSGALQPAAGDYVMVADANLGFNKANALVERQLRYQVSLAVDGSAQARARLVYHHLAPRRASDCAINIRYDPLYEQNTIRCYWDYPRLIVPAGAQLISGPHISVDGRYLLRGRSTRGDIDAAPIGTDKLSWGQLFLLAPQDSITLDYVYTLPQATATFEHDRWEYRLYLQKQPGTMAPATEVTISLPDAARLLDSRPVLTSPRNGAITFQFDLSTDREIRLSYTLP